MSLMEEGRASRCPYKTRPGEPAVAQDDYDYAYENEYEEEEERDNHQYPTLDTQYPREEGGGDGRRGDF